MGVVAATENQPSKSLKLKRSIVLNDRKTSVSLEEPFWLELKSIAAERKVALGDLISMIDADRKQPNLSSALRLFVLAKYYRAETADTVSSLRAPRHPLSKGTS